MKKVNFKKAIPAAVLISLALLAGLYIIDFKCGIIGTALTVIIIAIFAVFKRDRMKTVKDINAYLSRVLTGDYSLDIFDNSEGEISILKNNIYKVVVMLKSTNEELSKEKLGLASSLADITHQLKTPLTSITVMTDLLENEQNEEKRSELLEIIKTQTEKMNWLTATLLKLSRLDADAAEFNFAQIKISDVVSASIKPFLLSLDLKNIRLTADFDDFEFNGDIIWTSEAVKNIIKNCIEHTLDGGELKIRTNCTNLFNELIISDNGCGIDKDDLPHIFERFYHGKNASADSVGIGLNLAKEILSKQRADISAESKLGKGSVFRIRFYKSVV